MKYFTYINMVAQGGRTRSKHVNTILFILGTAHRTIKWGGGGGKMGTLGLGISISLCGDRDTHREICHPLFLIYCLLP